MMEAVSALTVPLLISGTLLTALLQGMDVFSVFVEGAKKGLSVTGRILPSLVAMLSCVAMLRASGLLDALTKALAPVLGALGIPEETAPLMLIRPLSGSGALAVGSELMARYGAGSLVGKTAAVMLGSTETTFYTVSVYFGSLGLRDTRYAIPAALTADLCGFVCASLFTRLLLT